jgi:hypothetical protein
LLALSQTWGAQIAGAQTAGTQLTHWVVQPPANGVYIGVYGGPRSNEASCEGVSRAVGRTIQLCDTYYSIYTLPRILHDDRYGRVGEIGSINVATLGCKGSGNPMRRPDTTFADIAAGRTDGYLQQDAAALKTYAAQNPKSPWVMIRLFHEFNMNIGNPRGNPNGNNCYSMPESVGDMQSEFISAWRHVVSYFASQGVTNVTWVWCPATGPQAWRRHGGDFITGFYPGDEYVDWTCADTYDKAPEGGGSANAYNHLDFFKQFHKPLMIGETGECNTESRFGRCAGYAHTQAEFIADTERELQPGGSLYNAGVRAWVYFDQQVQRSGYDWSLDRNGFAAFRTMLSNPYFYPPIPKPKWEI